MWKKLQVIEGYYTKHQGLRESLFKIQRCRQPRTEITCSIFKKEVLPMELQRFYSFGDSDKIKNKMTKTK